MTPRQRARIREAMRDLLLIPVPDEATQRVLDACTVQVARTLTLGGNDAVTPWLDYIAHTLDRVHVPTPQLELLTAARDHIAAAMEMDEVR